MLKGYYIHNQKKDESGVSKKIDAQLKVLRKHSNVEELILEARRENIIQRKIRMKILKSRPKLNYSAILKAIDDPDYVYIRKQVLDTDFLSLLKGIKERYPSCKTIMEVPIYPYWDQYPKNRVGKKIIEKEKQVIGQLPSCVDLIAAMAHEDNIFGIDTIQIYNGIDLESISQIKKVKKSDDINLIAVAKWRDVHGYEKIIDSLIDYYKSGGQRRIVLHMVGDGPDTEKYKTLARNDVVKDKVIFYGFLSGKELDKIYDKADIGLGVFALYKSGSEYVSLIKSGEYFAKGIPIVSSVEEESMKGEGANYTLLFANDETRISMKKIIEFYDYIYSEDRLDSVHSRIRNYAEKNLSYDVIMKSIVDYIVMK